MRRLMVLVLSVAAFMVATVAAMAAPGFAQGPPIIPPQCELERSSVVQVVEPSFNELPGGCQVFKPA
jgi:hypothetical protein